MQELPVGTRNYFGKLFRRVAFSFKRFALNRHQLTTTRFFVSLCPVFLPKLQIGHQGVALGSTRHGVAESCLELLGGALTKDQIRWIISSFSINDLAENGWKKASVPFLDDDDSTHLWSELHENCSTTEILLAVDKFGGAEDYIFDHILTARGETIRDFFANSKNIHDHTEMDEYVHANGAAIAIFHLVDVFGSAYRKRDYYTVAIKDRRGNSVLPSDKTFSDNSYPFMDKMYVGLVNEPQALNFTRPFMEYAYSDEGTALLKDSGYWPIQDWEKLIMYTRLGSQLGMSVDNIRQYCGALQGKHLKLGGSDTVLPIVNVWSEIFQMACPSDFELSGGGSSVGASRLCASTESGRSVDIGLMSRDFNQLEEAVAREDKHFIHDCIVEEGQDVRTSIQVDVALDGIAVLFAIGSDGEKCIRLLGGLTMDQLRWMYSSYSDSELEETGWDPTSLKNNDFNSSTHLWNEIDARCSNEEIHLSGDYWGDGSFTSFSQRVFVDFENGEHIADQRSKPYTEVYGFDALKFLIGNDVDAVSYVSYHYFHEHLDLFWAAPLAVNAGEPFVSMSTETIVNRAYPLVRSIFVNVLNEAETLKAAVPLIKFGFSQPELNKMIGYVPLAGDHLQENLGFLENAPYETYEMYIQSMEDEEGSDLPIAGIVVGSIIGALVLVACFLVFYISFVQPPKKV